jgi:uncharacterized protein YecE (DUF72 family)
METRTFLRFGTCSWKYESWRGVVYSQDRNINYLEEYSRHFSTVEVGQWFWSLFDNAVVLPKIGVVKEYASVVPPDFIFSISKQKSRGFLFLLLSFISFQLDQSSLKTILA